MGGAKIAWRPSRGRTTNAATIETTTRPMPVMSPNSPPKSIASPKARITVTPMVIILGLLIALSVNSIYARLRGIVIFFSLLPFVITPLIGAVLTLATLAFALMLLLARVNRQAAADPAE